MKVHHLNCGTMCPLGGRLMDGPDRGSGPARLVCHCLLIETEQSGLVLVDTGVGLQDVRSPRPRLSRFFMTLNRPQLIEEETALRQVERLGFRGGDVRHIVITHLDFDHAGGIEDFPQAMVHVYGAELMAARERRGGITGRGRYRPLQWDAGVRFQTYDAGGEAWFGFQSVRNLQGLPPEIVMVPLIGHTWGHCGIAIRAEDGWMLHAGDAYFYISEMDTASPRCTPGLRFYQWMMEVDRSARLANQERLLLLKRERGPEIRIFCAHDAVELQGVQARVSAAERVSTTPAQRVNSVETGMPASRGR